MAQDAAGLLPPALAVPAHDEQDDGTCDQDDQSPIAPQDLGGQREAVEEVDEAAPTFGDEAAPLPPADPCADQAAAGDLLEEGGPFQERQVRLIYRKTMFGFRQNSCAGMRRGLDLGASMVKGIFHVLPPALISIS